MKNVLLNHEQRVRLSADQSGKMVLGLGIACSLLFVLVIWLAGGRLEKIVLLPDQGANWYYWQLPAPTRWSQMTAWGGYLLHQLFL